MIKVLCIGGSLFSAKLIEDYDMSTFNSADLSFFSGHNFSRKSQNLESKFTLKIEDLINSSRLKRRAQLYIIYNYGKNLFKSPYFPVRSRVLMFSKYKVIDFTSLKIVLRHALHSNLFFLFFLMGFFRLPKNLVKFLLSINLSELIDFRQILKDVNPQIVVILDNGTGSIFFLLNLVKKCSNKRFVLLVYSWDNPTTKLFVEDNIDFIGVWNQNQIFELEKIHGYNPNKCKVIGSKLADDVWNSKFKSCKISNSKSNKTLIVLGMAANSDEVLDVIKIARVIRDGYSIYNKIVYRPHPLCAHSFKTIKSFQKDINDLQIYVDQDVDFSVKGFDGIVCFPSTLLLETIASQIPSVFYCPKYPKWRTDPRRITKAGYLKNLVDLKVIPMVGNLEDLIDLIKHGLPNQEKLLPPDFDNILPRLDMTYSARANELIKSIV